MTTERNMAESILKTIERLKSQRGQTDKTLQEISDYVLLNKGDFTRTRSTGDRRDRRVFDSTAIQAHQQLTAIIQGGLTDPSERWFNLRTPDEFIANLDSYKIWIEQVHRIMLSAFSSGESGFSQQNHETLSSVTGYGTGVMWVEDSGEKGITFISKHLASIYAMENSKGFVDTVYSGLEFTSRQAAQEWGIESLPKKIADAAIEDPSKKFEFSHCVMPKEDFEREFGPVEQKLERFTFIGVHVSNDEKDIIDTQGFHENPYLVPRWEKLIGEVLGRSPSWNALSDIIMVNLMSETSIKAAQKQVDPPLLMSDDGVMMPLQTFPGGINIGGVNDEGRELIRPLISGIRLDIGLEMMEQRRRSINSAYFVDQFQPRQGVQPLTATEANNIQENRLRLIGPQVKRIQDEYLSPLINRVFGILSRKGAFPPLPDDIRGLGMDALDLDIEYISPLAFTQKSSQLLSYNRFFANVGTFLQADPSGVENFNIDKIVREGAELAGIPVSQMKSVEQVAQERQAAAQAQQQQQQLEQLTAGAETAALLQKSGIPIVPEE